MQSNICLIEKDTWVASTNKPHVLTQSQFRSFIQIFIQYYYTPVFLVLRIQRYLDGPALVSPGFPCVCFPSAPTDTQCRQGSSPRKRAAKEGVSHVGQFYCSVGIPENGSVRKYL